MGSVNQYLVQLKVNLEKLNKIGGSLNRKFARTIDAMEQNRQVCSECKKMLK
jgi:hypothetical protein